MLQRFVSIAICGPRGSGKTALAHRLLYGDFLKHYPPTVGTDVFGRIFEKDLTQLTIYDHAGDVQRLGIKERQFDAILVVFDTSQRQQLNDALLFLQEHQSAGFAMNRFLLVGNKTDLPRDMNAEAARLCAEQYGVPYLEISCRLDVGIDGLQQRILQPPHTDTETLERQKRSCLRNCFQECWHA